MKEEIAKEDGHPDTRGEIVDFIAAYEAARKVMSTDEILAALNGDAE